MSIPPFQRFSEYSFPFLYLFTAKQRYPCGWHCQRSSVQVVVSPKAPLGQGGWRGLHGTSWVGGHTRVWCLANIPWGFAFANFLLVTDIDIYCGLYIRLYWMGLDGDCIYRVLV